MSEEREAFPAIPAFQSRQSREGGNPEGCGGRLRAIVRIRIFRIGGVFRISIALLALLGITRNYDKTNRNERLPLEDKPAES